jgi:hypothetical protein
MLRIPLEALLILAILPLAGQLCWPAATRWWRRPSPCLPYFAYKGDGSKDHLRQNALTAFQQMKPVAMAGYSIYIYHVREQPDAQRAEMESHQLNLP